MSKRTSELKNQVLSNAHVWKGCHHPEQAETRARAWNAILAALGELVKMADAEPLINEAADSSHELLEHCPGCDGYDGTEPDKECKGIVQ